MLYSELPKDITQNLDAYTQFYIENVSSLLEIPFDGDDYFSEYLYLAEVTPEIKAKIADDLRIYNNKETTPEDIKYVAFDLNIFVSGSPAFADILVRLDDTDKPRFIKIDYPFDEYSEEPKDNFRALGAAIISPELEEVTSKGYLSDIDVKPSGYYPDDFLNINIFAKLMEKDNCEVPDKDMLVKIMQTFKDDNFDNSEQNKPKSEIEPNF